MIENKCFVIIDVDHGCHHITHFFWGGGGLNPIYPRKFERWEQYTVNLLKTRSFKTVQFVDFFFSLQMFISYKRYNMIAKYM
jgi:hypothetical protein